MWMALMAWIVFMSQWCAAQQTIEPTYGDTTAVETIEPTPPAEEEAVAEGYDPGLYTPPPVKPVERREIGRGKWDDASSGLDYSKDLPKPPKQRKQSNRNFNTPDWNVNTAGIGYFLQILAVVLALAAIGYAIYRTLQSPRNRRIGQAQDGTIITIDNVDAYIHETDLERFLREALEAGNYSLAVRLYYLQTIKLLSEKGAIQWAREKTNRDYLRETRDYRLGKEFREATRTFERVWYGNEALDAAGFAAVEPGFKQLLGQI